MKVATNHLAGDALDWAVCKAELDELAAANILHPEYAKHYPKISPSTNPAQGQPIIEREKIETVWIDLDSAGRGCWRARNISTDKYGSGGTQLIAAMRCHVAGTLGEQIDLPEGLNNA